MGDTPALESKDKLQQKPQPPKPLPATSNAGTEAHINALIEKFDRDLEAATDLLFHADKATRQRVILRLQKEKGNQFVQSVLKKLAQPSAAATPFSGSVFLPGAEHLSHVYMIDGDHLVEKPQTKDELPRLVAKIDSVGNYYLIDASGNVAASPSGKLSGLLGQVWQKGSKAAVARTTASGKFALTGSDGKLFELTVQDGGVYYGKQLVGQITATGQYKVIVNKQAYEGTLEQLPAGQAQFKATREAGGKEVEGLQIGMDAVPMGTVYLNGIKFRVNKGQLFQDGRTGKVGEISVVRSGTGKNMAIKSILYRYVDDKGKQFAGDLLTGAGEQSVLEVGKKWMVRVGEKWEDPGELHKFGSFWGFARYGDQTLSARLEDMRSKKLIDVTDEEIRIFQSVAKIESSSQVQGINTYDNMVVSFGFKQWTMGHNELQDLIKRAPEAFKRYGIELGGEYNISGKKVPGIKGVSDKEDLRGAYWSYKFYQAGLDLDIIAAEVAKARQDLKEVIATIRKSPHLGSATGAPLILELANNRPAYVNPVVKRTLEKTSKDAAITEEAFMEILVNEIVQEYYDYEPKYAKSTAEEGMKKALRWTGEMLKEHGYKALAEKIEKEWKAKIASLKKPAVKAPAQ